MNNVKLQELGNELQSSQHLRLQCVSCKLLDIATVHSRRPKSNSKNQSQVFEAAWGGRPVRRRWF